MAGYRKLDDKQRRIYIGRTKRLKDAGYSAEQIAFDLKRPLVEVKEWFDFIDKAEANKAVVKAMMQD